MGFFKKKKKDKDKDAEGDTGAKKDRDASGSNASKPAEADREVVGSDPLGLGDGGRAPTAVRAADNAGSPGKSSKNGPAATVVDPGEGHRVAMRAASFLTEVARETRGLFEAVRPMAEVKAAWGFFVTDDTGAARRAVGDGSLDPHAAASLIVYHLRDAAEPLCTKALRADILAAAELPGRAERLAMQRAHCSKLPHQNRELLASIGVMVAAVAAEHDTCYKDGIDTRMCALGQLFGPLFLRPDASKFDAEMAAAQQFAQDMFSNPSVLSPPIAATDPLSPLSPNSSALPEDANDGAGVQLPQSSVSKGAGPVPVLKGLPQGSGAPTVPALKGLPAGGGATARGVGCAPLMYNTSKAVTFRAALCEKGGGDYPPNRKPPSPVTSAPDKAASGVRPSCAPVHRPGDAAGAPGAAAPALAAAAAAADSDDEETNYNMPMRSDRWAEEVKALSDDERKAQLQAVMKGGPMIKYSSRGRATALMFFKLSPDTDMLNWAPVSTPENLKYGLVMDQVVRILPGPLADGQFQGAGATSKPELRLVIMLQEDQRLEVEAMNSAALDMWAIALQHVVLARSPADPTTVSQAIPAGYGGAGTHRNWGAPETARGARPPGPVVSRLQLPSAANHGAMTTRLLNNVGAGGAHPRGSPAAANGRNAGAAGFATSRAPQTNGTGWGAIRSTVPAGPMTARGPGQGDVAPNIVALNAHVLLSKARHNRKSEMMALLDDPTKELHVDVADETGNSVLIIACQVRRIRLGVGDVVLRESVIPMAVVCVLPYLLPVCPELIHRTGAEQPQEDCQGTAATRM